MDTKITFQKLAEELRQCNDHYDSGDPEQEKILEAFTRKQVLKMFVAGLSGIAQSRAEEGDEGAKAFEDQVKRVMPHLFGQGGGR